MKPMQDMQVYAASRGQEPLKLYKLRYKDSYEQDKFVASVNRESDIFQELIRAWGHMVLPDLRQASCLHACLFASKHASGMLLPRL